jgi:predicted ATPase/DNA-binding CsgD family transcriptional regulator
VPQAVATVLGVREAPGRSLTDTLSDHLRSSLALLVLDNCEHLVESCASLAEALLGRCPELSILTTSREALGVGGETLFVVPPLSLPDPRRLPDADDLPGYEAARLFAERARAVRPGFEITEGNAIAVAQICYRLDGMPLAIELAAARTRMLSVGQIASRLDDRFVLLKGGRTAMAHHETLRATMDWSYDLLSVEEKILLGRLSVFAGGFTLEAAEAIGSGEDADDVGVLDSLASLVDKSLVLVVEVQDGSEVLYRLLETVRQYASEKLEESYEAERVRERHARCYLALAEEAEPQLREQGAWLERLEREHDNFRTALSWALESRDGGREECAELGLALAAALAGCRFWNAYAPSEGLRWLERGLAETDASPSPARAKALSEAGYLAIWRGDYERSTALLEEGMAAHDELGDETGAASALFSLGTMALHGGDRNRLMDLSRQAGALLARISDPQSRALLLHLSGSAALSEGDRGRAEELCWESLKLSRELGDLRGMALGLTMLGISALERGDATRARELYEEDLGVLQRLRDKAGNSYALRGMACAAALADEAGRAARLWGAAEAAGEEIGLALGAFDRAHPDYDGLVDASRARVGEAAWEAALAEGKAMDSEEAIEYALRTGECAAPPPEEATVPSSSPLSDRETEVLRLAAEGLTDSQVAQRLYVSPRTVGRHLQSVYRKLGVPSRAAAAREASERGLL